MYERANWPVEKVLKIADVFRPLPQPAQLLLQVHDNLLFECPKSMVDEVIATVTPVMEQRWRALGGFYCPVAIEVGTDWQELVAWEKYEKA